MLKMLTSFMMKFIVLPQSEKKSDSRDVYTSHTNNTFKYMDASDEALVKKLADRYQEEVKDKDVKVQYPPVSG